MHIEVRSLVLVGVFRPFAFDVERQVPRMSEDIEDEDDGVFVVVSARPDSVNHPMRPDSVNHPMHYGGADDPYEVIKVIEAWGLGFCLGNTVKYIRRAGKKDPSAELEDLEKARWYLDREIAKLRRLRGE